MISKNTAKKSLAYSALALVVCLSMLVGTTFAWFTDSVTSSGNIIKSGTLDVEMHWADGTLAVPAEDSTDWTDASTGSIFNYSLWEPGFVQVRHIKIANKGSLALKYKVNIVANGEVSDLSDAIDVYYLDPAAQVAPRTALTEDKLLGTLTDALNNLGTTGTGSLEAGQVDTLTIALKMRESAGNQYMDKAIGADFAIQLMATQLTNESDSFDDQYDVNATYPKPGYVAITAPTDFAGALAAAQPGATVKAYLADDITLSDPIVLDEDVNVELDLNGKTLSTTLGPVIRAGEGVLEIKNGTLRNMDTPAVSTFAMEPQRVSIHLYGDAVASITNVDVETAGIGLLLEDDALVTELNAKITSAFTHNGDYSYDAIQLNGNARIEEITGGEYATIRTPEYIEAWMANHTLSENISYTVNLLSPNASIGEIKGGTFLGEMDKANNGTPIHVNAGTVEKISGGYFGFTKLGLSNPIRTLYINTANGASIDQIVGGTFEVGSLSNGFGCDFEGIVAASGAQIADTGTTVDVQIQFSTRIATYTLKVWNVVGQ